ncbi:hypothetical protein BG011_008922 [Mortierella polycephala]|uniref:RING-type E3 ubiquitin transferase n=1 Tax=Mortierella polycephala TaxID=41804 RepID=A0A9P6PQ78_9FUNG|nr:hypothetical protein BG011_008922 [Mortierella polycephala]
MDMEHDDDDHETSEGSATLDGSGIHSRSSIGGQHSRPSAVSSHNMSNPVSRRFPYYHTHHHLYQSQNNNNNNNNNNNSSSSSSNNAATASGRTHIRNYSSPSLLDSFTSSDPMLSPIQSYFGSDPNSPASSFSLPRHDQYPRLSIDLDSVGDAGTMDGYHGFATHPWSEQSTTPARALSHRWTRRLSQPDTYPSQSNSNDHDYRRSSSSGLRRSSIGLSQPFAPAIMDQQWSENTSVAVSHMDTSAVPPDDIYDVDDDLIASEDPSQESTDEVDMEDSYDDFGAYHHQPDDLASSDDAGHLDDVRPYAYRYTTSNRPIRLRDPRPVDCEDDEDMDHVMYEVEQESNLQRFTDLVNGLNQAHGSMGDGNEMAQSQDMDPIRGTGAVRSTEYTFDQTSSSQSVLASSYREDPRARSVHERANVRIPESDEDLARRLQDEEYAALMGERDNSASASTALLSGSLLRSSASMFAPTSSSRHRSLRAIPRLAAYSARDRHQFSTTRPRTAESRSPHMRPLNAFPSPRFGELAPHRTATRESRPLERLPGARAAFIQAHSANSSVQDRPSPRSTPRSPSPTQSSNIVDLGEDFLRYTRTLQHLTRLIQEQQIYSRNSEHMWGNPADYLDDDQVDDSYEGLLRLSERIGDAVPRGVSAHTLQKLDEHIVSWKQLKCTNATNSNTLPSTLRHAENGSSVSVSTRASTINNFSSPSSSSFSCITQSQVRPEEDLATNDPSDENCTICLQTFEQSDRLRPLPCRHAFHVACIDEWLQQSAQCPICRQEVTAAAAASMSSPL